MCGIVGFSGINNFDLLRRANDCLIHRGPDEAGEFIDTKANTGIAMRRLSITTYEQ
jgi:asparagine synthase (glutamine-hydrolysing)